MRDLHSLTNEFHLRLDEFILLHGRIIVPSAAQDRPPTFRTMVVTTKLARIVRVSLLFLSRFADRHARLMLLFDHLLVHRNPGEGRVIGNTGFSQNLSHRTYSTTRGLEADRQGRQGHKSWGSSWESGTGWFCNCKLSFSRSCRHPPRPLT